MEISPHQGLEDDLRPRMAQIIGEGRPFALVTTFAADGGPRGVGAQMVVTDTESWGFVSGGCIEGDVAIQARGVLADGAPKRLVYGRGSPWIDLPLPCGGRLDLLAERIEPDDPAIAAFVAGYSQRRLVRYCSDGQLRSCADPGVSMATAAVDHVYAPPQRLIVVGSDPIAVAMARLARQLGWSAVLVSSANFDGDPGVEVVSPASDGEMFGSLRLDPWTAVAVATHEMQADERAILAALQSQAGYIGVLGARRRIADRVASLKRQGATDDQIAQLKMPIGLPIRAAAPWEIAVSAVAEIIAERRAPK